MTSSALTADDAVLSPAVAREGATELDLGPDSTYAWLAARADEFGFLRRYPWEPWHYGYSAGRRPCSEAGDAVGIMLVDGDLQMGATVGDPTNFSADAARVFRMFPILEKRQGQRGGTLSGGEQQMLAIARALMARPRLLLLDEPSLGLAPIIVKQIFEAIKELNRTEGLTVFLVEQNAFHALKLAHRGYVMVNGRITMSGTG